ncbi:MAG TPA: hypothetical protein VHD90_21235 [Phototrophicaceae bacterium]|nr:hypothetical protein [Phototrophicaceae bacterium]
MRFVLYSEKTVTQCLTAINARMHVKGTSSRPTLDGWVEKGGTFSINMTSTVIGKFTRRTRLTAKVERENGVTVIRGSVSHGASRREQIIIFVALALVAISIISSGNALIGLLLIPFAAYLYIPLHGDNINSAILLDEVEKTLKAKSKPPKKSAEPKASKAASSRTPAPARAASSRSTAAPRKKPLPAAPLNTEALFEAEENEAEDEEA